MEVGTYVTLKADTASPKTVYQVVAGAKDKRILYNFANKANVDGEHKDEDLEDAGVQAFMSKNGFGQGLEVAANAIVYSIIQKIRSGPTFGHRFQSFLISDIVYEFVLKYFVDRYVPMFMAAPVERGYGFGVSEFQDALKAVPIVLVQQIVQKMMYRQKWSGHVLKNIIDAFVACALANVAQRNLTGASGSLSSTIPGMSSSGGPIYRF